jgi:16S rRNA (cytidine1402-2'-O)-methyltransferase
MLHVVATPIGNMEDITHRAVRTLAEADLVACEDTRVTGALLKRYEISTPTISLNAANEERRIPELLKRLATGETIALTSDAGTPTISDPGARLVNAALEAGVTVSPVPGASAFAAAVSVFGLPSDSIVFEGFLPQKKGRQKKLRALLEEDRTVVLYESPYRMRKLLDELEEYAPERFIAVGRELTKKFEEILRGSPAEIKARFADREPKGEFVVGVAPAKWRR